jgi:predicted methyltransferase
MQLEEWTTMNHRKRLWTVLACALLGAAATATATAQAQDEQATRMRAALAAPERSAEDKARDAVRKPIETVQFLGIETGDTVIDLIAVGGWFTEVLSAAVGPSGKVIAQNPPFFVQRPGFVDAEKALHDRLGNVQAVHGELGEAGIAGQADAAITALNLHDIYNGQGGEAAAVQLLQGVYAALKPGGVLGVIDHVGVAGQDNASFHRIQPQQAKDAITKAGFTIEAESNILANPADDHTKGVRDPSVARKTDQFLIRARKPR